MAHFHTFNEAYYALKRQLEQESKTALLALPEIENRPMYVMDWWSCNDIIAAYGCDENLVTMRMRVDVEPGLYVTTSDFELLSVVCGLLQYRAEIFPEWEYASNNFAPHDVLSDPSIGDQRAYLAKITTNTFREAMDLFRRFSRDTKAYRYAHVPLYWSETNLVMFERMLKCHKPNTPVDYKLPNMIMRWFDRELNCYMLDDVKIPIMTFDIETVSKDANRVPTGEHRHDELYTVSIHHMHTKILYTLVYLPVNMTETDMRETILADGYAKHNYRELMPDYIEKNVIECFRTEKALLVRTLALLQADTNGRLLHFLVGYNSLGYDIKYLFLRAKFYNLPQFDRFIYRDGYAYGPNQIHLDLFRIMMMKYKMKNFKLSNVSTVLLQETKTGVDAVQLRFTFHAMRENNRYYSHEESTAWPSVRDTLHYNNYDTVLVSKLIARFSPIQFVMDQAHECKISIFSLNVNYNKMQFKLWSKCFVVGLNMGLFLGAFKSSNVAIKYPANWECTDFLEYRINLETQLNYADFTRFDKSAKQQSKYPGGANFCLGEFMVNDVDVLDYRIAYPLFIERMNVSDETATILPAKVVFNLARRLTAEQRCQFKTYDYMTHVGVSKSATAILYHQYIYNKLYCGKEFAFEDSELKQRGDSPVIVIWTGKRGLLSKIIAKFNTTREDTKNSRKLLDAVINDIDNKLTEIRDERAAIEALQQEMQTESEFTENESRFEHDFLREEADGGGVLSGAVADHEAPRDGGPAAENSILGATASMHEGRFRVGLAGTMSVDDGATNSRFGRSDAKSESLSVGVCDDDDDGDFGGSCAGSDDDDGDFGGSSAGDEECHDDNGDFGGSCIDSDKRDSIDDIAAKNSADSDGDFGCGEDHDTDEDEFGAVTAATIDFDESGGSDRHGSADVEGVASKYGHVTGHRDFDVSIEYDRSFVGDSKFDGSGDRSEEYNTADSYNKVHDRDNANRARGHSLSKAGLPRFVRATMGSGDWHKKTHLAGIKRKHDDRKVDDAANNPFRFNSPLIIFYPNKTFEFNDALIASMSYANQIAELEKLSVLVTSERDAYQNSYELQKAIVASIYGCLGRASKITAAITTNGIRRSILESAQYVVSLGYTVYYIDTDSLFIKHPTLTSDVSPKLNALLPHTEIERKVYKRCLFVQKKIYYTVSDGELRYSQNINGSLAWKDFIHFAYNQSHIKTNTDIYRLFLNFFDKVYEKLLSFSEITPELLELITKEVKIAAAYKNSNERTKLREFLQANYPTIASNYRQIVYYRFSDSIRATDLIPSVHLKTIRDLRTVNLFKFYHNVFKTVFNIIKFHIKRNNEPFMLTLDSKPVLLMMISAYLDVYNIKFPRTEPNAYRIVEVDDDECDDDDTSSDNEWDTEFMTNDTVIDMK